MDVTSASVKRENSCARALRQPPPFLVQKTEQQIDGAVGHIAGPTG
jgi:hypothetical protein